MGFFLDDPDFGNLKKYYFEQNKEEDFFTNLGAASTLGVTIISDSVSKHYT